MNQAPISTMRKAAILVASLDEQEGQQLIRKLPVEDAAILRQAVANLGSVNPEERREVLHELRVSTSQPSPQNAIPRRLFASPHDGVELDWSSSAEEQYRVDDHYDAKGNHTTATYDRRAASMGQNEQASSDRSAATQGKPFAFFGNHDTQTIAKILQHEPAQIIAVVISQLAAGQAAELLLEMPLQLQTEILERLAQLHPVDQHSLNMLESHLAEWLETHRQQEERASQGNEKVRQILAQTSDQHRQAILDKLSSHNRLLAHELEMPVAVDPAPNVEPDTESHHTEFKSNDHLSPLQSEDQNGYGMESLCMLSDAVLLDTLRKTDPQITMLALTGAPSHLLDRILGQLPRRQAKKFRRQLHSLQPTSIRDLQAAQQQFTEKAMEGARRE
jgi:flagellar motor switch protein FliG